MARHLAASIYLQMAIRPHILHIVGPTEAHHAATAEDVIEASKIARRAVENAARRTDMTADPAITRRRKQLVRDAWLLLEAIAFSGSREQSIRSPTGGAGTGSDPWPAGRAAIAQ